MSGQAAKEIPRWKRKPPPAAGPVITVKGRGARQIARDLRATPLGAQQQAAKQGVLARTGAYRFRRHLVPVWLLLGILAAGLGCQALHSGKAVGIGIALGLLSAAALWKLTRHLKYFGRQAGVAMAALIATWVPVLSAFGSVRPLLVLLLASWLPLMWAWAKHYRWRPDTGPQIDVSDVAIWARLAAKNKWTGHLTEPESVGNGKRYRIQLDGAETHIGQVMTEPRKVAAAWGKPVTEAYVEPTPDGIEDTGYLTILRSNTLAKVREWDGKGIDPATGMAVIGHFPDGQPVHAQWYAGHDGTSHFLVAGTTGSGKSELLSLLLCITAVSGNVIPIVLDPQEGQSLPAWRRHVRFAAGPEECMRMLRALYALMTVRSQHLAVTPWTDAEGERHDGMPFFDAALCGMPVIQVYIEEAPVLLKSTAYGPLAVQIISDLTKRGRKAGISVVLVAQVPSLAEMGGDQALRDMLVGGNAISLRTANKVSAAMIGMTADPSSLPKFFTVAKGEPMVKTYGLGYVVGPDNRLAPFRAMLERHPARYARSAKWPEDLLLDFAIEETERTSRPAQKQEPAASSATLSAVPPPEDDKPGRTAADAILAVLTREMTRGEIISTCHALVTKEWGRRPFSTRAIGDALSKLTGTDQIDKTDHGSYAPRKASLHSVSGPATVSDGVNAG